MWKRKDITTLMVLEAYERLYNDRRNTPPVEKQLIEATGAPDKVVWAAMERESYRGYIEYGVNLRWGWLTGEGSSRLLLERERAL